ncbi:MAG: hypothetical protein WCJ30_06740 [Deltaproteobacteria bacterium]
MARFCSAFGSSTNLRWSALWSALSLAVLAAGAGCSGRSPRYGNAYLSGTQYAGNGYQQTGRNAYRGGGGGGPVPAGATGMLQNADRVLRAQGYQPLGQAVQQRMPNRGLVALPINAQPGLCYAVMAIGDTGVNDVDMQVVSPSGSTVGQDQNPDIHPNVSFCAYEPGLHLARISVFSGAGNVLFAVYQGPPGSSPSLASAFTGGGSAPAAAVPTTPDPSTASRTGAFQSQMATAGYQSITPLSAVAMHSGETQRWSPQLYAGQCYTFALFGGAGVRDADLVLFDQGRQVARDTGAAVDAVLRDVCVTTTGPYAVAPRVASGDGVVWFAAYARHNPAATGSTAQVTQAPIAINVHTAVAGGIDASYNSLSRDLQGVGYTTVDQPVNQQLAEAGDAAQPVTLESGACYAIAAVGDTSVSDLDLFLTDAAGTEVDRDYAQDASPVVRVCPPATGAFTVRMHMTGGQGAVRLGLFRWASGTSGAGMNGLLFVRNSEVSRILQADGYQGDADFELVRGNIREGRMTTRSVSLRSGACYAFVAVGGAGVSDLNLALQQGRATVAEDRTLTAFPAVRYCARQAGAYNLQISSARGTGDFVFRVFRRIEGVPPTAGGGGRSSSGRWPISTSSSPIPSSRSTASRAAISRKRWSDGGWSTGPRC